MNIRREEHVGSLYTSEQSNVKCYHEQILKTIHVLPLFYTTDVIVLLYTLIHVL